jgi:hypothetical protein
VTWEGELSALESRADLDSLEDLHQRPRTLLGQLAPLKALHGHNGVWDAKRKRLLEALKVRHRGELAERGVKPTDAMVDAYAHADEQYERMLDQAERDKIEYLKLDNELTEIEEKIRNREFSLLAYNAETRLR